MQVDCGRADAGMPEQFLDLEQGNPILQQVGREGMAQGVNRDMFGDVGSPLRIAKGKGDGVWGYMSQGIRAKEKPAFRMVRSIRFPVLAQKVQGGVGKQGVPILGSLSSLDQYAHGARIDVLGFKSGRFTDAQTGAIDQSKQRLVFSVVAMLQKRRNLLSVQYVW